MMIKITELCSFINVMYHIDLRMDKEIVVYICNGILCGNEKE